jgi:hypothetical protein
MKRFFTAASFFAISVLLFTAFRQLLIFPGIARIDQLLFADLTFYVFSVEAIAYGFSGAIPDYFVRNSRGKEVEINLLIDLRKLCLLSFCSIIFFKIIGFTFFISFLTGCYLYFFSLNALNIKVLFNKMEFKENYFYMAYRCLPYVILFTVLFFYRNNEFQYIFFMAFAMLLFEWIYSIRLNQKLNLISGNMSHQEKNLYSLFGKCLPFIVSYLFLGLVQRGDLTFSKIFLPDYYVDYAKIILTINFFCAPLVLLSASPLLSFITNNEIKLFSVAAKRIFVYFLIAYIVISVIGSYIFNHVYGLLYGGASTFSMPVIFFILLFTLTYNLLRTFIVKYASPIIIIGSNALIIGLTFIVYWLVGAFNCIMFFFFARVFFGVVSLVLAKNNEP